MSLDMDLEIYESKLSKKQLLLLEAVRNSNSVKVQELMEPFQPLNQRDELFEYLVVVTALDRGHKAISKLLIKGDWTMKAPTKTGIYCAPLYYAVKKDDFEIFRALWTRGASLFDKDKNKESALELALREGKSRIINSILNEIWHKKVSKNLKPDSENDIALFHAACYTDNARAVINFMTHGFSLKSRSNFENDEWKGFTPLHFALVSKSWSNKTVAIIFAFGRIDYYAQDERGRTCVHLAFRSRHGYHLKDTNEIVRVTNSNDSEFINPVDEFGLSHFHIFCSMKFVDQGSAIHARFIKYLIDSGVNINASVSLEDENYPGSTPLHFAIDECSWYIVKLLLENGADPTKADKTGSTPLHALTKVGRTKDDNRLEILELMLQRGADPVAKDSEDRTPLHQAFCTHGERPLDESEKLLLSKSSLGFNHTDKSGISYLHMACTGGNPDIIETLLKNGAQVNSCIPSNPFWFSDHTALHLAVKFHRLDFVELLLAHGADASYVGTTKITSLHLACDQSQTKRLYSSHRKSDLLKTEDIDWLPSRMNQIRIIELLIEHGADVNAEDLSGVTPLMSLVSNQDYSSASTCMNSISNEVFTRQKMIMDILLRHGANINACSHRDGSILHILARTFRNNPFTNKELMKIALDRGADVNALTRKGLTPLHVVVEELVGSRLGNDVDSSLIDLLFEYNANVNAKNESLNTPLHLIVYYFSNPLREEMFRKLLRHDDIDVNAQNRHGDTSLHVAIAARKYFHASLLLNCGADVSLENTMGVSPVGLFLSCIEEMPDEFENVDSYNFLSTVIIHVKRLLNLRIHVSEKVIRKCETLSHYLPKDGLADLDCEVETEVQRLKSQKLDNYTSLYDILYKDANAMAKHVQNSNLQATIASIRDGTCSTFFDYLIQKQFKKGCERFQLLGPAKAALKFITDSNWPDSCSEEIFSFLSNDDLEKLSLSKTALKSKSAEGSRKRPANDPSLLEESQAKNPRYKLRKLILELD